MINRHSQLVNDILLMIGAEFQSIRAWKNATGSTKIGDRFIQFGLKGSADIIGIVSPSGKMLCIECKTGTAVQSSQQKNFQKMIETFGGIYLVARDVQGLRDNLLKICLQNRSSV